MVCPYENNSEMKDDSQVSNMTAMKHIHAITLTRASLCHSAANVQLHLSDMTDFNLSNITEIESDSISVILLRLSQIQSQ